MPQGKNSLCSWRYCVMKVLVAEPQSKKGSREEAYFSRLRRCQISLDWYSSSAAKSHWTSTQYCQLRRLRKKLQFDNIQINSVNVTLCHLRVCSITHSKTVLGGWGWDGKSVVSVRLWKGPMKVPAVGENIPGTSIWKNLSSYWRVKWWKSILIF